MRGRLVTNAEQAYGKGRGLPNRNPDKLDDSIMEGVSHVALIGLKIMLGHGVPAPNLS